MKYTQESHVPFIIFFITYLVGSGYCRRHCFSCSTQDSNSTCLDIPNNVTEDRVTVSCRYYCTIRRIEYVYIPERLALISLNRSCEKRPAYPNSTVVMDDYFITYYRSCRSNLCNFGDGRESLRYVQDDGEETDHEDSSNSLFSFSIAYYFSYNQFLILCYLFFYALNNRFLTV